MMRIAEAAQELTTWLGMLMIVMASSGVAAESQTLALPPQTSKPLLQATSERGSTREFSRQRGARFGGARCAREDRGLSRARAITRAPEPLFNTPDDQESLPWRSF